MLRKSFFVSALLLVFVLAPAGAQAVVPQGTTGNAQSGLAGTWSASSPGGATFMGTWTAIPDASGEGVIGTWTANDAEGRILAGGGWSAAKSGWSGAWRANVSGVKTEYSGSWAAAVNLKANARFAELFKAAVKSIVTGTWRRGRQSGAWSIQTSLNTQ